MPIDPEEQFDQFRHYQAVRIDPRTGTLVVSNSQAPVDALVEAYSFMPDKEKIYGRFAEDLMQVIGLEYDSKDKPTARVVGVSTPHSNSWINILAVVSARDETALFDRRVMQLIDLSVGHDPGFFRYVQTYDGNVDYRNFDPRKLDFNGSVWRLDGLTPQDLAHEVYEATDYVDPQYGDLRVCAIAGVRNGNGRGDWEIARKNRWNSLMEYEQYLADREKK